MSQLDTSPRFPDADAAFRAIVEAHRGLTLEDSAQLNAKLVLLLANHIGDLTVLREALAHAVGSRKA
jgi:Protein of unknown function (DUF2783)